MRIRKVSPVTPANGNIENNYGTSQTDTYSQEFLNDKIVNVNTSIDSNYKLNILHNSKNLLNFSVTNATITNTGDYTRSTDRLCFDYIPIEAGTEIIFSCNTTTSFMGIAFYDSNKAFLSRIYNNSNASISGTTPTNTKYVRPFINISATINLTIPTINQYEMQLELGNTRTTFETLINPSLNVNNDELICTQNTSHFLYTTSNGIIFDFYKYGKVVELDIKGTATFTAETFYSVEIDPSLEPASGQFRSNQRIVESGDANANAYITVVTENDVLVAKIRMKYSSSTATYPRAAVTYISK